MHRWWRKTLGWLKKESQDETSMTGRSSSHQDEDAHREGGVVAREGRFTQWILILAALGLAALLLPSMWSSDEEPPPAQTVTVGEPDVQETLGSARGDPVTITEYEQVLENQLKEILSKIDGVRDVSVMINLDSTTEQVVEKNKRQQESHTTERDREGGNRQVEEKIWEEQPVLIRQGNDEQPIVIKTKKPRVRGVLVVAAGAENMQVKAWITEAVQHVLDVPANRVSVLPKREQN